MRSVWIAVLMVSASAANAADIASVSAIESVTVYPDGASVVRTINVDVPAGDHVVVAPEFPLSLEPSSLRVEGEAPVQLAVGAVEAKPPRPEEPPKLDNARIEELQDEIGHEEDIVAAANLRLKLASSIVEGRVPPPAKDGVSPRPLAELQPAFGMVQGEALLAARDVRGAAEKKRELERQIAALKRRATAAPPSKAELRINVAAAQAGKATFRVTYTVRAAKWSTLYDARLTSPGPGNVSRFGGHRSACRDRTALRRGLCRRAAFGVHPSDRWWHLGGRARSADRAIPAAAAAGPGAPAGDGAAVAGCGRLPRREKGFQLGPAGADAGSRGGGGFRRLPGGLPYCGEVVGIVRRELEEF
jgi:N-terminal domain of unknown function (DUF4140)